MAGPLCGEEKGNQLGARTPPHQDLCYRNKCHSRPGPNPVEASQGPETQLLLLGPPAGSMPQAGRAGLPGRSPGVVSVLLGRAQHWTHGGK